MHLVGHAIVLAAVLLAVVCSVSTQFGMKHLIDVVAGGPAAAGTRVWSAFALLCRLSWPDNLLWRVAGYTAHRTFVAVTGDIRRDLFAYLSGHSPGFFAARLPGGAGQPRQFLGQQRFRARTPACGMSYRRRLGDAVDRPHRLGQC